MDRGSDEGRFDRWVVLGAMGAALTCVSAYLVAFWARNIGGPEAWGQFGDYVGGILNPLISLAAALLLIRSLRAARENNETASELLQLARRQHEIEIQTRRLDVALAAWERIVDERFTGSIGLNLKFEQASGVGTVDVRDVPLRRILGDRQNTTFARDLCDAGRYKSVRWEWNRAFNPAANILSEISEYCDHLDALEPRGILSVPYRRRVSIAAMVLQAMRQITEPLRNKLVVPGSLGDVGGFVDPDDVEAHIEEARRCLTTECVRDVDKAIDEAARGAPTPYPGFKGLQEKWPDQVDYINLRFWNHWYPDRPPV